MTRNLDDEPASSQGLLKRIRSKAPPGLKLRYRSMRGFARALENHLYDCLRFMRFSATTREHNQNAAHRTATIRKLYHRVEKALALPVPRPGFGIDAVIKLSEFVLDELHREHYKAHVIEAIETLRAYAEFGERHGVPPPEACVAALAIADSRQIAPQSGATRLVRKADLPPLSTGNLSSFFLSRHSVRQFSDTELTEDEVAAAVDLARTTPSVCNRQSCRVVAVFGEEQKRIALSHQNGNRGFGDTAGAILIVTSDLSHFLESGERYQGWIDGGMFSMTLLLALHSLGLGACPLNWSADCQQDKALRYALPLKANENIIMMIAVGHLREEFTVARSPRKSLDEVFVAIKP